MLKKSMLVLAILALLVGTLVAQRMRVQGNDDMQLLRQGNSQRGNGMMGDNYHHQAKRGMGQEMNNRKGDHQMREMAPGKMILAMSEELELTSNQIDNIKEIQVNFKKQLNTKQAEMKNLQIDKREAMQAQDFKKATKITKDMSKIKEDISLSKITVTENIFKELTKTQIELFKTKCKMQK